MLYHTRNPHGGDLYSRPVVLDFSANINPFGTPQAVKDAVVNAVDCLRNYPDPYCRELISAISRYEGVEEDCVLCGNGAAELIFSYCMALQPRKAMVLSPCFSEYETALRGLGREACHYLLKREDHFALTEAFLPELSAFDGDLLMLCNPNNPTGQVIEANLMEKILKICTEKNISLFVDECFLDLTEGGEDLSLKGKLREYPGIFLLKAFTKSYGMAGLRLGYCLCGNPELLRAMGQSVQPWNVSIPAQRAGVAALGQVEFLAKANEMIRSQRPWLTEELTRLGLEVIPSRTNYILFYSGRELQQPLLEMGIQIRSCANYPGLSQGWYRIAVKLPEENRQLIRAIEQVLKQK